MRAAVVLLVLTASTAAHAGFDDWDGGALLSYDLRYLRLSEDDAIGDLSEVMDAGLTTRAFAGKGALGIAVGLDLHMGGGLSGGFAHEANLYPLGYGVPLGSWGFIGAVTGVGVSGVTDRIPFGWQWPVETYLELDLGKKFHLTAASSYRWIGGAAERQTEHGLTPDERVVRVDLRFNRAHRKFDVASGNGYYVGFYSVQRMDETFYGVAIGYAIHMVTDFKR